MGPSPWRFHALLCVTILTAYGNGASQNLIESLKCLYALMPESGHNDSRPLSLTTRVLPRSMSFCRISKIPVQNSFVTHPPLLVRYPSLPAGYFTYFTAISQWVAVMINYTIKGFYFGRLDWGLSLMRVLTGRASSLWTTLLLTAPYVKKNQIKFCPHHGQLASVIHDSGKQTCLRWSPCRIHNQSCRHCILRTRRTCHTCSRRHCLPSNSYRQRQI